MQPPAPASAPLGHPSSAKVHPIVALTHPGGRAPGVLLPPTWHPAAGKPTPVPSALPAPGNPEAMAEATLEMAEVIRAEALAAFAAGEHPALVGGDHGLAVGTLAAALATHPDLAVVWIDAHADFNTPETSPSGNPHGMPLATACGLGGKRWDGLFAGHYLDPKDATIIAVRDVDAEEEALLNRHGVRRVAVSEVTARGPEALVADLAARFGARAIHLSFDFDCLDAGAFAATGTPVPNGFTPEQAEALLKAFAASGLRIVSSDWVEFFPNHPQSAPSAALARRMYTAFFGPEALAVG